jgi:hypothetical protein
MIADRPANVSARALASSPMLRDVQFCQAPSDYDSDMQKALRASLAPNGGVPSAQSQDAELARALEMRSSDCRSSCVCNSCFSLQTTAGGGGGGGSGSNTGVLDAELGITLTPEERQLNEAVLKCECACCRVVRA